MEEKIKNYLISLRKEPYKSKIEYVLNNPEKIIDLFDLPKYLGNDIVLDHPERYAKLLITAEKESYKLKISLKESIKNMLQKSA
ncbi:MAG TPA: hypothetical protein PLL26_07575 [Candidatus Dojkabacteria bacterium]|nr:hypothetical protein [Candidatus Dojkabacteria bacterium]